MIYFLLGLCGVFSVVLMVNVINRSYLINSRKYFYVYLISMTGIAVLWLLVAKFGGDFLDSRMVRMLSFSSELSILMITPVYIFKYNYDSLKAFELNTLFFLIPIGISVYTLYIILFTHDVILPVYMDYVAAGTIVIIILMSYISLYSHETVNAYKSEMEILLSIFRDEHMKNELLKNNFSEAELSAIEEVTADIYLQSLEKIPSALEIAKILRKSGIHSDPMYTIMERLYSGVLLRRCSMISLTEFRSELLPELFPEKKGYRSYSMDVRYYEDFTEKIRYMLKNENKALDELNRKIDSLNQHIGKNMSVNVPNNQSSEVYGCQNQIRELFHALETPIATAEMAISNLAASFDSLTDMQKDKFVKTQNNIKLIKSILFAYRELTFMNVYSSENTFFSLPVIIDSMKDMVTEENDSVMLEQQGIPDSIPSYSTNLIVVLILPLIHNAIEASPAKKSVVISYKQSETGGTIQIENYCKQTPKQVNLDTDGYSSKGNHHEGTGISIVRRISKSVGVDFHLKVYESKVTARLEFPKH